MPKRWIVELTVGRLNRARRPSQQYDRNPGGARARARVLHVASLRRIASCVAA